MKKVMLSAAALMVFFAACNKSDDNNATRQEMLVGTWNLTEWGFDLNPNGTIEQGETSPVDTTISMTSILNSDGTGTMISHLSGFGTDTTMVKWSLVNGDQVLRTIDGTDTSDVHIKGLDGSKLTVLEVDGGSTAQWVVYQKQ